MWLSGGSDRQFYILMEKDNNSSEPITDGVECSLHTKRQEIHDVTPTVRILLSFCWNQVSAAGWGAKNSESYVWYDLWGKNKDDVQGMSGEEIRLKPRKALLSAVKLASQTVRSQSQETQKTRIYYRTIQTVNLVYSKNERKTVAIGMRVIKRNMIWEDKAPRPIL